MTDLYMSAEAAALELGVSVTTLYAYVGRKQIRSRKVEGTRQRHYWRADIERIKRGDKTAVGDGEIVGRDSDITLVTPDGPFYRGHSAIELSDSFSLEQTAALLWGVDQDAIFSQPPSQPPPELSQLSGLLAGASSTDRAIALLPFFEHANPRAFDLSALGMARSGADVMRWYAALLCDLERPAADPLHEQVAASVGGGEPVAGLVRRALVLSADHAFGAGTYAVRAVASTGVSPYRSVLAGFAIVRGRRNTLGRLEGIARLLDEIATNPDPKSVILRRLQDGEEVPGFASPPPYTSLGDPRALCLLDSLRSVYGDHPTYVRVTAALGAADEVLGMKPSFALVNTLFSQLCGLKRGKILYVLGRCAGWVAHSIEQYHARGAADPTANYKGSLPPV